MVGCSISPKLQLVSQFRFRLRFTDGNCSLQEMLCNLVDDEIDMQFVLGLPKMKWVLSSDKSKPKTAVRTSEMNGAASVQQQPHTDLHAGQGRSDASRPSHAGKFLILKPLRENGVPFMANDASSPIVSRVANYPLSQTKSRNDFFNLMRKKTSSNTSATLSDSGVAALLRGEIWEAAKSRNDFFNLMRKKTSSNTSATLSDSGVAALLRGEIWEAVKGDKAPASPCVTEDGSEVFSNGYIHKGGKNLLLNGSVYSDEEEAAFLRALGWEENAEEGDGLTEDEINAFYQEYMKLRPSLKVETV
ncbi:uncharacterized protein LOC130758697 [Actinidia eriantha]|uniref:uncharacterized protein LOC130758697 n=1 Tax=Actinidia eriantha TaxID=165200 RepID=UPI00258706C7|nr:uncharacterized protein LOC130758697 [Actinidia eriantha]